MDTNPLGTTEKLSQNASQINGSSTRRPQTLIPPVERKLISPPQNLTLTIHKDSGGYGMKVSGDNPVYVESVKPGGAAQKAGLLEGDMILKVGGTNVRCSTHINVVHLIKSSANVELTVQRNNYKMPRPSSVSVSPSTPLAQRGGITGPKPVDSATSHEMKLSKMKTLHLYLDKEKKNLEKLLTTNSSHQDILRAETTIRTLQEQLQILCGDDPAMHLMTQDLTAISNQPQTAPPSTPAFLSRFPRSLSSLSLGTKKKSNDKENSSSNITTAANVSISSSASTPVGGNNNCYNSDLLLPQHLNPVIVTPSKKKICGSQRDLKCSDIPPPLPQRNVPRKIQTMDNVDTFSLMDVTSPVTMEKNPQISDLDIIGGSCQNFPSPNKSHTQIVDIKGKQRLKTKAKALSDPKISSQTLIEMEKQPSINVSNEAPPLPPRQPGMIEEKPNKFGGRPPPNSLETHMNYPLIATCTAVRDNMSAFPLSHRPNVVQQLQQNNQHNLPPPYSSTATTITTTVSKSTALGLTSNQMSQLENIQHRLNISSPEHCNYRDIPEFSADSLDKSAMNLWETQEKNDDLSHCPPGTPPPFYDESMTDSIFETSSPNNSSASIANQRQIISMEDDEMVDDQDAISEDHGPFRSLHQLLDHSNLAYLAVFVNFVFSNSNPAPLLFYLITSLYKEGNVKDMRKWAYEIHSTFLVPRAPLQWIDSAELNMLREVDDVLQNEYNKVEILRKLFWSTRRKAKERITVQLNEFQVKRTAGLGTMFGPSDHQLMEAKGDKVKEQKIVEETLLPKLQQLVDELEKEAPNECPKKSALSSALSTVLHRIFITRSNPGSPIDRVHHFVSREKSFKSRLMGKHRKAMIRGHHLVLRQYNEVTHCNHCQNIIWGVSPQGYHCTDCELNIHRACSKVLEENCPGPAPSKQKAQHTDTKMSKFMEKIRPTQYFINAEKSRRQDEDGINDELLTVDRPSSAVVTRQPSDHRPDHNVSYTVGNSSNEPINHPSVDMNSSQDVETEIRERSKSKSAPVSVNRSESYKERLSQRRTRNTRRKTSDPSLSKVDDHVPLGLNNSNFTASSSSSLSSSLDSPSTSLEVVGAPIHKPGSASTTAPRQWMDSEDETCDIEADWSSNISVDILQTLSDGEKKRQEIINEIYQTERNHVRTLRLLDGIFLRPLQESGVLGTELLRALFPSALLLLKEHHSSFEQQLKQRRIDNESLVGNIGDLLLSMFDGHSGEDLKEHAAQFCARQQIALEALKEKRRKDENLQRILTKAESHKACRRLQLKDLLPTALQRLTKYPLLFESLHKITLRVAPDNELEAQAIKTALDASRRILDHVNQAVRIAEDAHKLQQIQKKLDKSNYEKESAVEFKNLDLTQHNLIHDGPLITKKNPGIQLHGLLFETMMVLLQKKDDKFILKYHTNPCAGSSDGSGDSKIIEGRFNPITKINLILVRLSAVDKNTFFLINTNISQMLELTAPSSLECKTWFKHISDAAEMYKSRTKSTQECVDDINSLTVTSSSTAKEPLDVIVDKDIGTTIIPEQNNNFSTTTSSLNPIIDTENSNEEEPDEKNTSTDNNQDDEKKEIINNNNVTDTIDDATVKEYSNNSNKTRTLTQQCSLVAPSEVQVSVSPALTAEPVLTPSERLRRLDVVIRETLAEKQKIVCDMFKIPNEHFSAIVDVASQPEAPNEPSEIVLAAFAQIQSLTETLNEYIKVSTLQEISAVSTSLCENCYKSSEPAKATPQLSHIVFQSNTSSSETTPTGTTVRNSTNLDNLDHITDDDGYCDIDEIRFVSMMAAASTTTTENIIIEADTKCHSSRFSGADDTTAESDPIFESDLLAIDTSNNNDLENCDSTDLIIDDEPVQNLPIEASSFDESAINIHKTIDSSNLLKQQLQSNKMSDESCGANRLIHAASITPAVPCQLILDHVTTLSLQISQLLPKLNERDIEREKLRKENLHLQELLNTMHENNRISNEAEIPHDAELTSSQHID